jgi:hypothetical protein
MKESRLTASEVVDFVPGSIQKFELRTKTQWIVYHVIPYSGFIVEKTEPGEEPFPTIIRIMYKAEDHKEWMEYYEKLVNFQKKFSNVQVTSRRRIAPLSTFKAQKIKD